MNWNDHQPQHLTCMEVHSARAVIRSPFFARVCDAVNMPFTAEEIVEEIEKHPAPGGNKSSGFDASS